MRQLRSSVAAAQICNYLQSVNSDDSGLQPLETFLTNICAHTDNAMLLNILTEYGWDNGRGQFDHMDVDLHGLRIALSKNSQMLATRTSQLGPNLTPKSFAPAMLLSYLCHVTNKDESCCNLRSSYTTAGERPSAAAAAAAEAIAAAEGAQVIKLNPVSLSFHGVCLLVDISGFTRLSGNFCALGKVGIDGLQQATNGYMGRLVEVIYRYGGDIIKFAGDAIICVFLESSVATENILKGHCNRSPSNQCSDITPRICKHAMHCAMELRDICTETLTVHVAVSCGEMNFGIVGGFNDKWECLIAGDCLMQLSQCLEDAPSKQVAVTGYFGEVVGSVALRAFGAERLSSGNHRLVSRPQEEARAATNEDELIVDWVIQSSRPEFMKLVNMFVPLPVTLAFESGGLRYLAEIREVTTLFMKWDSYNTSDYADLVQLQAPFVACQGILHELGGFVRQFLVDDKGCVLIALWGVPTSSYLNNAHRALSAAAKMRCAFQSMGLQCSMGITTGNVYCGNVGSEIRREYAAVGDTVNLSARLMSKAHGGIYIDEATYSRLAVSLWNSFDALEPLKVKGKANPVPAYAYQPNALVPELPEPAIEEYEIKTSCRTVLLRLLEKLHSGTLGTRSAVNSTAHMDQPAPPALQLVVLEGRMGSGKNTTAKWLMREAVQRDIRVIKVSNLEPRDALLEYKLMACLMVEFIGQDVWQDAHKLRLVVMHILKAIYGDDQEAIERIALPCLRAVLGAQLGVTMIANESTRSHMADRTPTKRLPLKLVADTLRDMCAFFFEEEPTVVIIEHLHYADEGSLKCLMAMRDLPASGLLLMTTLSVEDMAVDMARIHNRRGSVSKHIASLEPSSNNEALEAFRAVMSQHEQTAYIRLDDFNVTEIDAMIRAALSVSAVPLGLAQWVQQLSGGSIYWINEMLEFIKTTGIEEFMTITAAHTDQRNLRRHSTTPHKTIHMHVMAAATATPPTTPPVSKHVADLHEAKMSQLEHFILSRFEKLPLDDQRILKTASVIGYDFSRYVLHGILPTALKPQLHAALKNLVKEKWINKLSATSAQDAEYVFAHPLAWETLYGLIPPGDRTAIHRLVAEYYEKLSSEPSMFERISSHYSYCDPPKAVQYAMRAAAYYLQPLEHDMQRTLNLLLFALKHIQSAADVQVGYALLDQAKSIFTGALEQKDLSSQQMHPSVKQKPLPRPRRAWLLPWICGCAADQVVAPSTVLPTSVTASSAYDVGVSDSAKSLGSILSHVSVQSLNEHGKECVLRVFQHIDRQLSLLRVNLLKPAPEDKQQQQQQWHKDLLLDLEPDALQ